MYFFQSENFPRVFSQLETSKLCIFPKPQLSILAAALGPLDCSSYSARPSSRIARSPHTSIAAGSALEGQGEVYI